MKMKAKLQCPRRTLLRKTPIAQGIPVPVRKATEAYRCVPRLVPDQVGNIRGFCGITGITIHHWRHLHQKFEICVPIGLASVVVVVPPSIPHEKLQSSGSTNCFVAIWLLLLRCSTNTEMQQVQLWRCPQLKIAISNLRLMSFDASATQR